MGGKNISHLFCLYVTVKVKIHDHIYQFISVYHWLPCVKYENQWKYGSMDLSLSLLSCGFSILYHNFNRMTPSAVHSTKLSTIIGPAGGVIQSNYLFITLHITQILYWNKLHTYFHGIQTSLNLKPNEIECFQTWSAPEIRCIIQTEHIKMLLWHVIKQELFLWIPIWPE